MSHRVIKDQADVEAFAVLLGNMKLPVTLQWTQGQDRSLDQNALQFLWAKEAAEQLGDRTTDEMRCEWKLHHGVPILRADNPDFRAVYDKVLKPLPYEMKLKMMRVMAVTSEMKVRQMCQYLDTVQRECLERGIRLTDPDPELAAYQKRNRERKAA